MNIQGFLMRHRLPLFDAEGAGTGGGADTGGADDGAAAAAATARQVPGLLRPSVWNYILVMLQRNLAPLAVTLQVIPAPAHDLRGYSPPLPTVLGNEATQTVILFGAPHLARKVGGLDENAVSHGRSTHAFRGNFQEQVGWLLSLRFSLEGCYQLLGPSRALGTFAAAEEFAKVSGAANKLQEHPRGSNRPRNKKPYYYPIPEVWGRTGGHDHPFKYALVELSKLTWRVEVETTLHPSALLVRLEDPTQNNLARVTVLDQDGVSLELVPT